MRIKPNTTTRRVKQSKSQSQTANENVNKEQEQEKEDKLVDKSPTEIMRIVTTPTTPEPPGSVIHTILCRVLFTSDMPWDPGKVDDEYNDWGRSSRSPRR